MSLEYWQEVINDYEKLLENGKGYDVIIYASENQEIRAHSLVLSTRSQYFCTELSKENIEKRDGKIILKNPDIPSKLFKMILRFIYCGRIDLTTLEGTELLKLSMAVAKFNITTLFPRIEEYLIKNQSGFLQQTSVKILETVYQHESFTNIWNFCLENIYKNPKILFNSDELFNLKAPLIELLFKRNDLNLDEVVIMLFNSNKFINLKAPLLELIIKRDDLILDEIIVWNSLLKWGLAQNTTITQDSTNWNEEEIKIMERTLHRFIPLVRFYSMPPEHFLDRVYPLKELLPKDLFNGLLTFHITPNRKSNIDIPPPRQPKVKIDSVIIQFKHLSIFASWIDKKENFYYNVLNTPYNFTLLYRASIHGNTPATFHNRCDNKGATIVVVKIANSEEIVGGYNPLVWDQSNSPKSTKDSFIFSFTNKNNLQTAKVGYIKDANIGNAIYSNQSYGPAFGGGYDLFQNSNSNWQSRNPHSYPKIDIPENFTINGSYKVFNVVDYEVFQVIKK